MEWGELCGGWQGWLQRAVACTLGEIYSGRMWRGERVQMQKKRPRGSGFGACSGGKSLYDQAA